MALTYEEVVADRTTEKPAPRKTPKKTKYTYPVSIGKTINEPDAGLTFSVAEEDVVGSVVADKEGCAAAKALCKMPEIEHAWVFRSRTLIRKTDGTLERYKNPRTLAKAVDGFDTSAGFFPAGEYQLEPLTPSSRKEAKKVWNDAHKERFYGKRPYAHGSAPKPLRNK